ncbi:hypothetical protein [Sphingomonas sp. SRS2]|uniref:hypothetical protein n=1 Tax=Sphingomonas sp. SRS2 TaxID=133190 RepID=UPI0006184B79|nr:hypothetical protein [Sphingomonas sp. SRS2]KKC25820.1 hypothetical protein WP12_12255 [Sphingomonas sp. SRS2]
MTNDIPMLEKCGRAVKRTLAHHGVVLHPDDVTGLVIDVLNTLSNPDDGMIAAGVQVKLAGEVAGQMLTKAIITAAIHHVSSEGE